MLGFSNDVRQMILRQGRYGKRLSDSLGDGIVGKPFGRSVTGHHAACHLPVFLGFVQLRLLHHEPAALL